MKRVTFAITIIMTSFAFSSGEYGHHLPPIRRPIPRLQAVQAACAAIYQDEEDQELLGKIAHVLEIQMEREKESRNAKIGEICYLISVQMQALKAKFDALTKSKKKTVPPGQTESIQEEFYRIMDNAEAFMAELPDIIDQINLPPQYQ